MLVVTIHKECGNTFATKYIEQIIAIAPRLEPLETPIEDPRKETIQSNWGNYSWTKTVIKEVDNA